MVIIASFIVILQPNLVGMLLLSIIEHKIIFYHCVSVVIGSSLCICGGGAKYHIAGILYMLVLIHARPFLERMPINMQRFNLVSWIIDQTFLSLFSQM